MGHGERFAEPTLVDRVLPIDGSRPPRRAAFNALLRAELHLSLDQNERALDMLAAADGHGLLDVVWLERCPLLEPIRSHPRFVAVKDHVAVRAQRVIRALDARTTPSVSTI